MKKLVGYSVSFLGGFLIIKVLGATFLSAIACIAWGSAIGFLMAGSNNESISKRR